MAKAVAIATVSVLLVLALVDLVRAEEGGAPDEVIVITGTRSERPLAATPVPTEVIDREAIEAAGVETVAEALALRPGLWLERGVAGTGVTMQGLGPEYVLVLVDGQRQIGRVGGAIDLDRLAAGDVERIEVVRGPGSALYGADALGGVIHVVRRAPEDGAALDAGLRVDGRLATDAHARADLAGARWSAGLAAGWRRGPAFDRTPATAATTIAAYDETRATARAGWRPDARAVVELAAEYARRDLRGVDGTAAGAVLDRHNRVELPAARATARWTGDATIVRAAMSASAYRDQYLADQRGSDALDRYEETLETLGETSASVEHARGRHRVTGGVEALREGLDADRLAMPGVRWRAALHVQDEWRAGAAYRWLVVPAARVDHDSQFGTHATPRLAVRWDPTDDVVVRVSGGAGFRAPSFKELLLRFENPGAGYVVEGNPMLAPERSVSAQLGVAWRPAAAWWVAASTFDNELTDLITTVALDGGGAGPLRFGHANVGRARTRGVEATAVVDAGRLGATLGWAYTQALDLETRRALEGVPAQRVAAGVRWRDDGEALTASADAVVTGPRAYAAADGGTVTTAARVEVRARVARRFGDALTLYLGVENLLDAGDDRHDPIAPRTLYAGASLER